MANRDKRAMVFPVKRLVELGFDVLATEGTAEVLRRNGVAATVVRKHVTARARRRADDRDRILAGEVDLIINTPFGTGPAGLETATRSAPPPCGAASRA